MQHWDPRALVWRQIQQPARVGFGQELELLGHTGPAPTTASGTDVPITLFWRATRQLPVDYTVGVFLVEPAGPTVVAQNDQMPVTWYRHSSQWAPGEVVAHTHVVRVPDDTLAGRYQVWVVVYELQSLRRLTLAADPARDYWHLVDLQITTGP